MDADSSASCSSGSHVFLQCSPNSSGYHSEQQHAGVCFNHGHQHTSTTTKPQSDNPPRYDYRACRSITHRPTASYKAPKWANIITLRYDSSNAAGAHNSQLPMHSSWTAPRSQAFCRCLHNSRPHIILELGPHDEQVLNCYFDSSRRYQMLC
jgi:hypothetical protein